MKLTIPDLAKLCGVSRGTVDRALNDRPGISKKTREYILSAARQNGYTPNVLARSLVTGKSNTIGIVVFDLRNRHFSQLICSIHERIAEAGYFSYICITEKNPEQERRLLRDLVGRNVEGIILMPINDSSAFEEELAGMHVPVVTVSNRLSDRFSYVGSDFFSACYQGMNSFYAKGYRQVSFICPCADGQAHGNAYAQIQRAKGYERFMADHLDMHGELITTYDYFDCILHQVQNSKERLGFFCSSDFYALNILHKAREHNLRIPEDFGLMGFDRIDTLDYLEKPLSTVAYPIEEVGLQSANLLLEQIANPGGKRQELLIDCSLIGGATL